MGVRENLSLETLACVLSWLSVFSIVEWRMSTNGLTLHIFMQLTQKRSRHIKSVMFPSSCYFKIQWKITYDIRVIALWISSWPNSFLNLSTMKAWYMIFICLIRILFLIDWILAYIIYFKVSCFYWSRYLGLIHFKSYYNKRSSYHFVKRSESIGHSVMSDSLQPQVSLMCVCVCVYMK